jgi:hypothetical protein
MVVLIHQYLVAVAGLAAGALAGLVIAKVANRARLAAWDARVTAPLLLAAGGAHLVLIPLVELERQVLFTLYVLALLVTTTLGLGGVGIWRLGAVLFPAGSILGYAYFAALVHQADYVGLAVKIVELAAIASALQPLLAAGRKERRMPHATSRSLPGAQIHRLPP